eukprot:g5907.t1
MASSKGMTVEDSGESTPDVFICPVSRELMRDPVALVDTGQIYDRSSIIEWFKKGHNTCPLTGTRLTSQRLTPLYAIRNAVHEYASTKGIVLESLRSSSKDGESESIALADHFGPLDDPGHCLSIVTSSNVSAYDVVALFKLVQERRLPQSYAALVLLREMTRHIDGSQLKRVRKELHLDTLRELLHVENLKIPAARLLVQIKGLLKISELIHLLRLEDLDLRREILTIVRSFAYRHRGKMMEVADAIEHRGVESCLSITSPLISDPESEVLSIEALDGAAMIISSLSYRARHRHLVADRCIPGLVRHWRRSEDPGIKYPIAKAIQYLCEDPHGRTLAQAEGVVAEFHKMLPPAGTGVDYSDFVFDDFFAFVTVPDTALKALHYLAQNSTALKQMVEQGVVPAVREMISTTQLSDETKSKYAKKLLEVLTNSPEFRLRQLMNYYRLPPN